MDCCDGELAAGWVGFLKGSAFVLGPLNVMVEECFICGVLLLFLVAFELTFKELATRFVFLVAGDGKWWGSLLWGNEG
jgi:hypothetical protein